MPSTAQQMIPCEELAPSASWQGEAGAVARFDSDQLPNFLEDDVKKDPATWEVDMERGGMEEELPAGLPQSMPARMQDRDGQGDAGMSV